MGPGKNALAGLRSGHKNAGSESPLKAATKTAPLAPPKPQSARCGTLLDHRLVVGGGPFLAAEQPAVCQTLNVSSGNCPALSKQRLHRLVHEQLGQRFRRLVQ